jgi:hypothetical protein
MTYMRYWAMTLIAAAAGGFLALDKYAFAPNHAIWIAFAVAIAATVGSLAAAGFALARQNHLFSALSAFSALIAGFTIIATRTFTAPSALWIAFAGGLSVLLVSLRALALHEATIERVVHSLELNGAGQPVAVSPAQASTGSRVERLEIPSQMRSWLHWLTHTALGLGGAFVVLATFAWPHATAAVDPRWLWFGIGVAGVSIASVALIEYAVAAFDEGTGAIAEIVMTVSAAAVSAALVVTMVLQSGINYRWTAFALGAAMVGVALVASLVHELTGERVRHELEVAHGTAVEVEVDLVEAR